MPASASTLRLIPGVLLLALCSCQTTMIDSGPPEIRMPESTGRTLAIIDVWQGEERVATLRERTLPKKGVTYEEVTDARGRPVGIIRDNVAERYTAHEGLVPVATGANRRVLVAAVLGLPTDAPLELRADERVAAAR